MTAKPKLNPFLKLALDLGPLGLFFFANSRYGIFTATATFMIAVLAALAVSYALTRQLPIMPVVTAIIVVVFGGVLIGGLFFNKPVLGIVFDSLFHLTGEGWRKLTGEPDQQFSNALTSSTENAKKVWPIALGGARRAEESE